MGKEIRRVVKVLDRLGRREEACGTVGVVAPRVARVSQQIQHRLEVFARRDFVAGLSGEFRGHQIVQQFGRLRARRG